MNRLTPDECRFLGRAFRDWRPGYPDWTMRGAAEEHSLEAALQHPEAGNPIVALAVLRNGGAVDITRRQVADTAGDVYAEYVFATGSDRLDGDINIFPARVAKVFEQLAGTMPRAEIGDAYEGPPPGGRAAGIVGPTKAAFGGAR